MDRAPPVQQPESFAFRDIKLLQSEVLGAGSYGQVCRATCDGLPCAAKVIHSTLFDRRDPGSTRFMQKFDAECRLLSRVRHPNVVLYLTTYHDPVSKLPVLLMELCDECLTKFLERSPNSLSFHLQVNISHDVALALVYLHANEVIHRDLTSNNVLMIAGSRAKVTDFGMSKLASVDPRMTPLTQCPGNMLYMSPEALSEEPTYTKNLDIFSLGVLVVQILTREFPDPTARFEKVDMSHDPKLSCKTVQVAVPEVERRSNHLSLINDGNPLKTLSLECLRDAEKPRPTAQELNVTLREMKQSEQYKESIKLWSDEIETSAKSGASRARLTSLRLQVQDLKQREMKQQQKLSLQQLGYETAQRKALQDAQMDVQRLQGALKEKERQLQEVGSCLEREKILKAVVEAKDAELRKIQQKFVEVQHTEMRLRSQIEAKDRELYKCREELQAKNQENLDLRQRISTHPPSTLSFQKPGLPVEKPVPTPRNAHIALRLERKIPSPYSLKRGSMAVYKKTAFITSEGSNKVYQITLGVDRWNVLPDHNHFSFGLAVFDGGFVTSVGGWNGTAYSNKLLTLNQDRRWVESYPAMPTARIEASVVSAQNVLVVTGGYNGVQLDIVEVLTLYNKQWATAPRLPQPFYMASALVCDNQLYLAGGYVAPDVKSKSVLTCSIADLLHSPRSRYQQVWTEAGKLPYYKCTLVSQGEVLMAVGGKGDMGEAMSDVLVYEPHSESWRRVSNLAIARNQCFAFSFSGDVLYVLGGEPKNFSTEVMVAKVSTMRL